MYLGHHTAENTCCELPFLPSHHPSAAASHTRGLHKSWVGLWHTELLFCTHCHFTFPVISHCQIYFIFSVFTSLLPDALPQNFSPESLTLGCLTTSPTAIFLFCLCGEAPRSYSGDNPGCSASVSCGSQVCITHPATCTSPPRTRAGVGLAQSPAE